MPRRREAWAAWNFLRDSDDAQGDVCVTYSMQHLQNIDPARPLFVTLNPPRPPRPELVFRTFSYAHPQFTQRGFAGTASAREDQTGRNRVWMAGAWTGYGFHEDGLRSGLAAAEGSARAAPWSEIREAAKP